MGRKQNSTLVHSDCPSFQSDSRKFLLPALFDIGISQFFPKKDMYTTQTQLITHFIRVMELMEAIKQLLYFGLVSVKTLFACRNFLKHLDDSLYFFEYLYACFEYTIEYERKIY